MWELAGFSTGNTGIRRAAGREGAGARYEPRGADSMLVECALARGAVLDQPRGWRARRELPRQHRVWSSISLEARAAMGRFRRRGLRPRCPIPGRQPERRPRPPDDQRRQRRRLYDFARSDARAPEDFQRGASYCGVSDLAMLANDTHKFESRYLDWLVGPYPQDQPIYADRSPINHIDRLSVPIILFQGAEDKVVPPNQTEMIVAALNNRGIPVGYFLFDGEQHGFRKAETIKRALDAELYFYAALVLRSGLHF